MPTPWLGWTRTLPCKSDKAQVHDPVVHPSSIISTKSHRSFFSKSIKDAVNGRTKSAPKSSSSLRDETRVCSRDGHDEGSASWKKRVGKYGDTWNVSSGQERRPASVTVRAAPRTRRKLSGCTGCDVIQDSGSCRIVHVDLSHQGSLIHYRMQPYCRRCRERFDGFEALEQHHVAFHTLIELRPEDSSHNVVEIIFRSSWFKTEDTHGRIERILKIQNSQKTIAKFEQFRDIVKARAANSTHTRMHARCLVDGNELLRFHPTTLQCSLRSSTNSFPSLCTISTCKVCSTIRSGFSSKNVEKGIYTAATSGRAHTSLLLSGQNPSSSRLAMLVCRVISGRMYRGYDNITNFEFAPPEEYESICGELSSCANVDDLYVLSPRAVLPCFVVIYRC